jgi:uroporphyrinogen-III decarboxylase
MANVIEIGVPIEAIATREERVNKTKRFETPDRVAVIPAINYRYLLPRIGVRFKDYYSDPEVMLRSQILGQKWLMENIKTDAHSITGAWVGGWTDFQNVTEASAMGCEVEFPENDIPLVHEEGWVRTEKELRRLEQLDIISSGLNGRQLEFRRAMMQLADKYPVRFQGGPIFYPGANPALTHTSHGPFTNAACLMGTTELFAAILERPDFVCALLHIITEKIIAWLDFCWEEEQLQQRDLAWTDDLAAYLSADTWQRVLLPYNQRLREHFDWASLHMCGHTDHLLEIFTDQLKINEYQGFGWQVNLDRIAAVMGGKVVLLGNVSPLLIASSTPEQVKRATRRVIGKLAPYGGLIIQDGNNIAPESPVENINAMMEAAEEAPCFCKGEEARRNL